MKKVKMFLSVAAVAGMTALMGVSSAMAGTAVGKVTMLLDIGAGSYYVYISPLTASSTPSTVISYCKTVNSGQVAVAAACLAGRQTCRIIGGTVTTGYFGNCTWVDALGNN